MSHAVLGRHPSYVHGGLRVISLEEDWRIVQETPTPGAAYVSVVTAMGGQTFCACADGLRHSHCVHVDAAQRTSPPKAPQVGPRGGVSRNRGARNGRAKLDEHQAGEIAWLALNSELHHDVIGARYGISAKIVSDIARGRKWVGLAPRPVGTSPFTDRTVAE